MRIVADTRIVADIKRKWRETRRNKPPGSPAFVFMARDGNFTGVQEKYTNQYLGPSLGSFPPNTNEGEGEGLNNKYAGALFVGCNACAILSPKAIEWLASHVKTVAVFEHKKVVVSEHKEDEDYFRPAHPGAKGRSESFYDKMAGPIGLVQITNMAPFPNEEDKCEEIEAELQKKFEWKPDSGIYTNKQKLTPPPDEGTYIVICTGLSPTLSTDPL